MAKKQNDINSNFEKLKKQMMQKREIAEKSTQINTPVNTDNNTSTYTNTSENNDVDVNTNIDVNINDYSNTNIYDDNSVNNNTNNLVDENINNSVDITTNKFVIKKANRQEQLKRTTYYLKPSTIKKIDKYSKAAGMGKSEFVQKILEDVLNNIEIN